MSSSFPDEWKIDKITNLSSLVTKGATPTTYGFNYVDSLVENGARFVRGNNASLSGKFLNNDIKFICSEAHKKLKRSQLQSGDVIISIVGSVGASFQVDESVIPANINQNVALIRPNNELDSNFLKQVIASELIQDEISQELTVQAQPSLSLKQIGDFKIPAPPLPEQQKIAKILSSVDEVIEKTQAQIDKLKDLKTGMMQELLTNGIGHTEFKDSPVGRIPAEWEVKPLIDVVQKIIDCEHKTAPYVEKSEYLVVRTTNVRTGELLHKDMKFTTEDGFNEWTKRAIPSVGDVLFTREAPAGESCLVPNNFKLCMGQRMVLLRLNYELVNPDYFSIYLNSEASSKEIYQLSIGTTVSRINIDDIKKIKCVVPPISEQNEIADSVSSIQKSILKKQEKLDSSMKIKKALMQDLLTGKVRVKV